MQFQIRTENMTVPEKTKTQIETEFNKLAKYQYIEPTSFCHIDILAQPKDNSIRVKVTIDFNRTGKGEILSAEATKHALLPAIVLNRKQLEKQLRRLKDRRVDQRNQAPKYSEAIHEATTEQEKEDVTTEEDLKAPPWS